MSSKKHSALLRMMVALFAVLGISFIPTVIIALIYGEYFEGLCFGGTMAALALVVATMTANSTCFWLSYQPEEPEEVKMLKKD